MSHASTADSNSRHNVRFPNESPEYRVARDALLDAEVLLRRQIEAVAQVRRGLPLGGEIPTDYEFQEGDDAHSVRLSELFGGKQTLIAYSFMFSAEMDHACPNCTSILDALDGEAQHVAPRASLVVIAKSPIDRIRAFAEQRGWTNLRLLSSSQNSYNRDYHGENVKGEQTSALNVFACDGSSIRHTFAPELQHIPPEPGQSPRHLDLIWPLWNLFDLTRGGRGRDHPKLQYDGQRSALGWPAA